MPLTSLDTKAIWRSRACPDNADTVFFITPENEIGHLAGLHVDTAHASGRTGAIRIELLDVFAPLGGASGSVSRFRTQVMAGDVGDIPVPVPVQFFGSVRVQTSFSGPIVSMGVAFE